MKDVLTDLFSENVASLKVFRHGYNMISAVLQENCYDNSWELYWNSQIWKQRERTGDGITLVQMGDESPLQAWRYQHGAWRYITMVEVSLQC